MFAHSNYPPNLSTEKKKNVITSTAQKYTEKDPFSKKQDKLSILLDILYGRLFPPTNNAWLQKNVIPQPFSGENSFDVLYAPDPLNQFRSINTHLSQQNKLLKPKGILVCWYKTISSRKDSILKKYPKGISYFIYFADFIWNRAFPKVWGLKKIYYLYSKKRNRLYPRAEILGRLFYNGLSVLKEEYINGKHFIIAEKNGDPSNGPHSNYSLIIKLRRIGKDGQFFTIYKIRTMHAYSEFLQSYIYEHNKLQKGGKFANDYRIPGWGRFLRKYWIDEFPMLINLISN